MATLQPAGEPLELISIDYQDLLQPDVDLTDKIQKAYGPGALGLLTVAGVPELPELRSRLLPLAQQFANLPEDVKACYEDRSSSWSFGWSHGREHLEDGRPDKYKGSYYANPCLDCPTEDATLKEKYPSYCNPNIWPSKHLSELEPAFKELGKLIVRVGIQVAEQCDRYVAAQQPSAASCRISDSIKSSSCHKARLLHYFPPDAHCAADTAASRGKDAGSWCGWHRDHGSLTGLTAAMFASEDGHPTDCPDPQAGLYVKARAGQLQRVLIPEGHIAYQLGEVAQALSGGLLCATPHCVKAPSTECTNNGISRNTFAVFMQPHWDEQLELPLWASEKSVRSSGGLEGWLPGRTFGEFTTRTISNYY